MASDVILRANIAASLPHNPLSLTLTHFVSSTGTRFSHISPFDLLQNDDLGEVTSMSFMKLWRCLQREAELVRQRGEAFSWSQEVSLYAPGYLNAEEETELHRAYDKQRQTVIEHILEIQKAQE